MDDEIRRPIDFARFLTSLGLSLRKAHETLNRIAAGGTVAVELETSNAASLVEQLDYFGVIGEIIQAPAPNIQQIRQRLGLSQLEFATRFAIDADNLKNWEQGRYKPDATTNILFSLIETNPKAVEAVLRPMRARRNNKRGARGQTMRTNTLSQRLVIREETKATGWAEAFVQSVTAPQTVSAFR